MNKFTPMGIKSKSLENADTELYRLIVDCEIGAHSIEDFLGAIVYLALCSLDPLEYPAVTAIGIYLKGLSRCEIERILAPVLRNHANELTSIEHLLSQALYYAKHKTGL